MCRFETYSFWAALLLSTGVIFFPNFASSAPPELPRSYINTTYSPPTDGTTHVVNAGDNLQSVINAAQPGDVILLQAGATFTGEFLLPNKGANSKWIYIMSSACQGLPPPGTRVGPNDAQNMPRLTNTDSRAALRFTVIWDGKNQECEMVAPGIYIALVEIDRKKETRKIAVIR